MKMSECKLVDKGEVKHPAGDLGYPNIIEYEGRTIRTCNGYMTNSDPLFDDYLPECKECPIWWRNWTYDGKPVRVSDADGEVQPR